MEEILVSVIMPAYNAERYIEKAIQSVFEQEVSFGVEILVIDDGSQDRTKQIVQQLRNGEHPENCVLQYIPNDHNIGVAESRNRGIRRAKGRYVAFLDADDWWAEGKLEAQVALLEEKQGVLCCTGRELVCPDGSSQGRYIGVNEKITYDMLLRTNSIPCSSVLIRTKVAREFEMEHDELHEDYILWLKVLRKYRYAYGIDEPYLMSRLSDGGKSRNKLRSAKMHLGVYQVMGIPKWKACYYFLCYFVEGVKKYYGRA